MIVWSNCEEMDVSALRTLSNNLFMEVEIVIIDVLIERVQVAEVISISEWVAESKINFILLFTKMKIENAL